MSRKRFRGTGLALGAVGLLVLLIPSGQATITSKTATGLVTEDQGIMPDSGFTEAVEIRITETDTGSPENPVDDGPAYLQAVKVQIDPVTRTARDLVSRVALYRITQSIEDIDFDFDREFDFGLNRLIASQEVTGSGEILFNVAAALPSPAPGGISGDEIWNTTAIYYMAVATTRTIKNEEVLSVEASDIRVVHPLSADPNPALTARSLDIRCVVSAGDLIPVADFIDPDGMAVEYPLGVASSRALPHNYPDYSATHPDALNELRDLEIPVVRPAESGLFPVLGIELAGVRSDLSSLVVNFVSVAEARNDDLDAWIDEPGGTPGAFDPCYDEIFRDVNRNGKFDTGDVLVFAGANGVVDASQLGVDDDLDGLTDEERLTGRHGPGAGGAGANEDRDYYLDENGTGSYEAIGDEFYRDVDNDGLYSAPGREDQIVDLDGSLSIDPGSLLDRENIAIADPLNRFHASERIAYHDLNGNGQFDFAVDTLLRDFDGDGLVTLTPDLLADSDGSAGRGTGAVDVKEGRQGTPLSTDDRVFADSFLSPEVIFIDNAPPNAVYDEGELVLYGNPATAAPAGTYSNVADATAVVWTYADDGNFAYDDGEDIWINFVPGQLVYSERRDDEAVILGEPSSLVELDPLGNTSEIPNLVYFDGINPNSIYDDGEDIYYELVPGRTYTDPTVVEGIRQGTIAGFSLRSGDAFEAGGAVPLIDEDVNISYAAELIDEDLRDTWYWVDSDGNGIFDVIDLDGDRDFVPNEDANGNGILDQKDNNGDGDFDDEEDYTEDLNGDGNLDLGVSGNDELYFDYDGDGAYDPQVGGQEIDLDENIYPGADGLVSLRPTEPYPLAFSIDEDGDGERAPDGSIPLSAHAPASVFGSQPSGEPFIMANGIDDDGDGLTDEGINEDLGDDAFDAVTVRTHHDLLTSNDYFISDVESLLLFRDDGDGVFDPAKDIQISRDDPEACDWQWLNVSPPVYTAVVFVDDRDEDPQAREQRRVPRTDGKNYDFFLVMSLDGDDEGDEFPAFGGALVPDGLGVRYGDDFIVTLAPEGINTDAGTSNEGEISKVQECILYVDDIIGFTGSDIQADDTGVSSFRGNPYLDAESSAIAVLGIDFANSPVSPAQSGGIPTVDFIEQLRVHVQEVGVDEVSGATDKGIFEVHIGDGTDNDGDGRIDEDPADGVDNDTDGLTDEDGGAAEGTVVTVPDLKALAEDSTGGIGLYRDDDTPQGDGIDDDQDGVADEELVNGLDDDGDGLIDEDVGDDDPAGTNGVFDPYDDPLPLRNTALSPLVYRLEDPADPSAGACVNLNPLSGAVAPPNDTGATTRGYDYYVVVRSSNQIEYRDSFKVSVQDGDIRFRSGRSSQNSGVTGDPISANVPVFMTDLTVPDQSIATSSPPVPVIGLNLFDRNQLQNRETARIDYLVVGVFNEGNDNDFTPGDLLPFTTHEDVNGNGVLDPFEDLNGDGILNTGYESGIALYRDKPGSVTNGGFDDPLNPSVPDGMADSLVYLSGAEYFGNLSGFPDSVLLKIDPLGLDPGDRGGMVPGETVPPSDSGEFAADDYFLVIRTSESITDGEDFRVVVAPIKANERVQWPMKFLPGLRNGVFDYNASFASVETGVITVSNRFALSFAGLVPPSHFLEASSEPTAVLAINVQDGGNPDLTLFQVKLQLFPGLADTTDDDVESGLQVRDDTEPSQFKSDLTQFSNTEGSCLSIYEDSNGNGRFDVGVDQRLERAVSVFQVIRDGGVLRRVDVTMNLSAGVSIPDNDYGTDAGPDFFVTVRTSDQISYLDSFSVRIPADGVRFQPDVAPENPMVTAGPLRAGVPVSFSDQTLVFDGVVGASSLPLPAIGIDLNVGRFLNDNPIAPTFTHVAAERLVGAEMQFNGEGSFVAEDIAPLLTGSIASGLALYRDADRTGDPEHFDDADTFVPLSPPLEFSEENAVEMTLLDPANDGRLPRSGSDPDAVGPDYFIVFRTSDAIPYGSSFSISARRLMFLNSTVEADFTTGTITASSVNQPPSVALLTPESGATASGGSFVIRWADADPDSAAAIDFFSITLADYEAQAGVPLGQLAGTVPIPGAQDLPEDPDGEADCFPWNLSGTPPDEYIVIARIADDVAVAFARSPGTLTIANQPPAFRFIEPDGVDDTVIEGEPFTITWIDEDPDDNATIQLIVSVMGQQTIIATDIEEDDETDSFVLDTSDLVKASKAAVYVMAVVDDATQPEPLYVQSRGPITVLHNQPPRITITRPNLERPVLAAPEDATGEPIGAVAFGGRYEISWFPENDDEGYIDLYYDSDDQLRDGTLINTEGPILQSSGRSTYVWDTATSGVTEGTYWIYAVMVDSASTMAFDYSDGPVTVASPGSRFQFGGVVLDSSGTLHYLNPAPSTPNLNFSLGECAALAKARGGRSYLVAGKDGAVTVIGEYPVAGIQPGQVVMFSRVSWDAVDVALSPDEEWVYLLHANGQIAIHGSGDANPFVRTQGLDFGSPYAAALGLTRSGRGAYLLDQFGGVYVFGDALSLAAPYLENGTAVDLKVAEGGYYILTSLGDLYPVGDVPPFETPDTLVGIVAMDVKDHGGVVLLDQFGTIATVGVEGFSIDGSGLPLMQTAADMLLLDSRY